MSNTIDLLLFSGPLERGNDYSLVKLIEEKKNGEDCILFLTTLGGNPDVAYKISRFLQHKYDNVVVAVAGLCKSAGTLLAIGANEVIFSPYGELGPLDIQLSKVDQIARMESGLNISEAFYSLEQRARETYSNLIEQIIGSSGGVVSFQTASHAATEIVGALYGPIFSRIDPEEVGSRSRAMRIGADYAERLNTKFQNLKERAIERLSESYSSHAFVIDFQEAEALFHRARLMSDDELEVVSRVGSLCRHPGNRLVVQKLGEMAKPGKHNDDKVAFDDGKRPRQAGKREGANGRNPASAG
jgi:hypothetical protein